MNTYEILTFISPLVLILGVLSGLYYFKHLGAKRRLLLFYLMMCLSFDFISRFIGPIMENNLILWPLFSLVELMLFFIYYYKFIKTRKVLLIPVILGFIYMLFEIIYIDTYNVKAFQSYSKIASSFLIVFIVLSNISWLVKYDRIVSKGEQYLNYAIMINFALNLFLLLPINLLVNGSSDLIISIWILYLSETVLFYSYLSYEIWKNGKNRKRLCFGSS